MKSKRGILPIAVIIMLLFAVSCEYEFIEPITYNVQEVSFSTDIAPLLNANCTTCHNGSLSLDLRVDKSYQSLIDNRCVTAPAVSSILMTKINSNHGSSGNLS